MKSRTIKKTVKLKNEPLAFHLYGIEVRTIKPHRATGRALPRTLLIPPGVYRVHGRNYRLREEGLCRFLFPGKDNQQRIVYRRYVWALLSGLSWISSHGSTDNQRSNAELGRIALTRKLIVTCGKISEFGCEILEQAGVRARLVHAKTLQSLNTYNTGHVLMEACLKDKWTLVDLDCNRLFQRNRKRLSLLEFTEAVAANDFNFEQLSAATGPAIGGFTVDDYDYGLFMETTFGTEPWIRRWYQRIMMVPIIHADGLRYFTVPNAAQRSKFSILYLQMNARFLSRREFIQKFYPTN